MPPRLPAWIPVSAVVGAIGAVLALTLVDRRALVPHGDLLVAGGMITFLVACTAAFIGFLRWRDRGGMQRPAGSRAGPFASPTAAAASTTAASSPARPQPALSIHTLVAPVPAPDRPPTIYDMEPGVEYIVLQSFRDHYQQPFEAHQRLRFIGRAFLPYHGGHTLFFEGRAMYLQEEQNVDIIDNFARFLGYAP